MLNFVLALKESLACSASTHLVLIVCPLLFSFLQTIIDISQNLTKLLQKLQGAIFIRKQVVTCSFLLHMLHCGRQLNTDDCSVM